MADKKTLLMVAFHFPPVQHSGTLRSEAFARLLPNHGWHPIVLTRMLDIQSGSKHTFGVQETREGSSSEEFSHPVPWDLRLNTSRYRRLLRRIPVLSSGVLNLARRVLLTGLEKHALTLIQKYNIQAIYGTHAPPESLMLCAKLAEVTNLPVIMDLRDPWSYVPSAAYRHFVDFLIERRIEKKTLQRATRIIVTCQASKTLLERKLGIEPSRISVVENGYNEEEFASNLMENTPRKKRFVFAYIGELATDQLAPRRVRAAIKESLGFDYLPMVRRNLASRSPKWLLQAYADFLRARPELRNSTLMRLVGINSKTDYNCIVEFPFSGNLEIIGRVSKEQAADNMNDADVLVLIQEEYFLDGQDFCIAVPGKLYSYLRAGKRILPLVQPQSDIEEIIKKWNVGMPVHPRNVAGIRDQMEWEYDNRFHNVSTKCDFPEYSREYQTKELAVILERLIHHNEAIK
jgi:glycosyltransferase involved in cell wall biosynthesis